MARRYEPFLEQMNAGGPVYANKGGQYGTNNRRQTEDDSRTISQYIKLGVLGIDEEDRESSIDVRGGTLSGRGSRFGGEFEEALDAVKSSYLQMTVAPTRSRLWKQRINAKDVMDRGLLLDGREDQHKVDFMRNQNLGVIAGTFMRMGVAGNDIPGILDGIRIFANDTFTDGYEKQGGVYIPDKGIAINRKNPVSAKRHRQNLSHEIAHLGHDKGNVILGDIDDVPENLAEAIANLFSGKKLPKNITGRDMLWGMLDKVLRFVGRDKLYELINNKDYKTIASFQQGGKIPSYGGGDRIPILAEAGEYIVNKQAAKRYHSVLENINDGNTIRGYQSGGSVGPTYHNTGRSHSYFGYKLTNQARHNAIETS